MFVVNNTAWIIGLLNVTVFYACNQAYANMELQNTFMSAQELIQLLFVQYSTV